MNQILTMGLLVGIFMMLFVTPYAMCKGIIEITYDDIDSSEKIKCMIPLYNMFVAEPIYTGGKPKIFISTLVSIIIFIVRMVEVLLGINNVIAWVTIVLLVVSMLITYLMNAVLVFSILKHADVMGYGLITVFAILFPIGQYYIGNFLPKVLRNALKQESTFLE